MLGGERDSLIILIFNTYFRKGTSFKTSFLINIGNIINNNL